MSDQENSEKCVWALKSHNKLLERVIMGSSQEQKSLSWSCPVAQEQNRKGSWGLFVLCFYWNSSNVIIFDCLKWLLHHRIMCPAGSSGHITHINVTGRALKTELQKHFVTPNLIQQKLHYLSINQRSSVKWCTKLLLSSLLWHYRDKFPFQQDSLREQRENSWPGKWNSCLLHTTLHQCWACHSPFTVA